MAALQNGSVNGATNGDTAGPVSLRFSDIPSAIEVPVQGDQEDEAVEIDLMELGDDPTELCTLFENERAAKPYWMTVALAYAKQGKVDHAIEMLLRGSSAIQAGSAVQGGSTSQRDKVSMICCLCWMYLWKSREAPRVAPEGTRVSEAKTKEYYLQLATSSLNDAARLNPSFSPMYLARGVLLLLRASLQAPPKTAGGAGSDKYELLKTAVKAFDDALRVSQGKNVLALMGKARALFSMQKYGEALTMYQDVLLKMPDLIDPDPRIGIGCCLWQLGFKEDARAAWERSLELNPKSKIANILLGQFYLDASGHVPVNSDEFLSLYKKAMTEFTQKAFKLDKDVPLTCSTFASYFLSRKAWDNADKLAHKAIQYTDVNAIASDGWYLLARKEHYEGNADRASDYYRRADDARGGTDSGYLPAKFGIAQLSVLKNDLGEAKLRLEKMIQQSRNYEAMILLGTLYAEEIFASQDNDTKEDKSAEMKKAFSLLEGVRAAWKDPKKNLSPDASVLLNLARLYETENPEKALQCLQQVEQLELDQVPESEYPKDVTDEADIKATLRKFLPPQLLNNIGCFHFQAEKHDLASEMFEAALGACMFIGERDPAADTDALVSTISFNLGRSYEARGLTDKAVEVYDGLLARHDDYTDARTRLAYIKLRKHPNKEGPDAVAKLYQDSTSDLEVRALYGWYLGKVHSRKRPTNVTEDHEFRHYKHTLQNYDKHDRYALVGMGNLYLMQAREMRRETEHEKQKRSAVYGKAVEFFEKALSLDPKNAYAAQGVAIALIEDKKDYKNALPILHKIRDTVKDAHVYVNLGHVYAELRQYTKAIEHYEIALSKEGKANDPLILACLGRTWLNRGRKEENLDAYDKALECAQKVTNQPPPFLSVISGGWTNWDIRRWKLLQIKCTTSSMWHLYRFSWSPPFKGYGGIRERPSSWKRQQRAWRPLSSLLTKSRLTLILRTPSMTLSSAPVWRGTRSGSSWSELSPLRRSGKRLTKRRSRKPGGRGRLNRRSAKRSARRPWPRSGSDRSRSAGSARSSWPETGSLLPSETGKGRKRKSVSRLSSRQTRRRVKRSSGSARRHPARVSRSDPRRRRLRMTRTRTRRRVLPRRSAASPRRITPSTSQPRLSSTATRTMMPMTPSKEPRRPWTGTRRPCLKSRTKMPGPAATRWMLMRRTPASRRQLTMTRTRTRRWPLRANSTNAPEGVVWWTVMRRKKTRAATRRSLLNPAQGRETRVVMMLPRRPLPLPTPAWQNQIRMTKTEGK